MVGIIDYGVGNIFAFQNVYKRLDIPTKIAKTATDLEDAQKLILPGVGAFDETMRVLNSSGLKDKLDKENKKNIVINKGIIKTKPR